MVAQNTMSRVEWNMKFYKLKAFVYIDSSRQIQFLKFKKNIVDPTENNDNQLKR